MPASSCVNEMKAAEFCCNKGPSSMCHHSPSLQPGGNTGRLKVVGLISGSEPAVMDPTEDFTLIHICQRQMSSCVEENWILLRFSKHKTSVRCLNWLLLSLCLHVCPNRLNLFEVPYLGSRITTLSRLNSQINLIILLMKLR